MTPSAPSQPSEALPVDFTDGFGSRVRLAEAGAAEPLQLLRLSPPLAAAPGFDFALRERVSRLANFRHAYYARVRRVDRLDGGTALGLVSEVPGGARLSQVLEVAARHELDLDVNAALCLVRQLVPAVALLHQNARDVSHGAIAPERIVVTPNARVVIAEYVLGASIEALGYSRERLWKELRVAIPPGAGTPRLGHRIDVMQIGVVALALVLGRPLRDDDLRDPGALVASATETSALGGRQPLSDALRRWLTRALQLDPRGSFESALEAQLALDDVLSGDGGYVAAPVALESFLAEYDTCSELERETAQTAGADAGADGPAPVQVVSASAATEAPASPSKIAVPPSPPRLGLTQVSANAPAVPTFRAVVPEPPRAPEPPAMPEPAPAAAAQGSGQTSNQTAAPARSIAPPASQDAGEISGRNGGDETFDEAALRARFIEASSTPESVRNGVAPFWRIAAMLLALVAAAEAAYIGSRMLGSSAPAGRRGTLKVDSRPSGAQVKVNGQVRGTTPMSLPLDAGAHVVEIAAGAEPRVIPITLTAGETLSQYVELPGAPSYGRLSIASTPPGATVLVNGEPRGTTPVELADVEPGEHEIVLDLKGRRVRQAVTVNGGVTTTVALSLDGVAPEELAAGLLPAAPPAPALGHLVVQVPFEMRVLSRGAQLGLTSNRLALPPGTHDLEIVSDTLAFRTTARVEIAAGRTVRLPIELPNGVAHLNATPWAEVWIDGAKVGETPIGNLPVTIGPHEIVFRHPELGEQAHAATVTAAAPLRLSVDLTKTP
jgi:hypothetical protein